MRYTDAEAYLVPEATPRLRQRSDSLPHFKRHEYRLERRVLDWNWVVEDNHHAVAGVPFERAVILDDDFARRQTPAISGASGIGIAHGFATLGTIGFEGRFDYAAIGTVSNVASRLCDEAKPGQILISPRVLMKVENAVRVEPVGEFELRGLGGLWGRITYWLRSLVSRVMNANTV